MTNPPDNTLDDTLAAEMRRVTSDLTWLDRCTCHSRQLSEFFVGPGYTLSPEARNAAESCPTRREELIFAYARNVRWGYFGAFSPRQRATMSLPEALAVIDQATLVGR